VIHATRPDMRSLLTTLGQAGEVVARAGVDGPALILIGTAIGASEHPSGLVPECGKSGADGRAHAKLLA
jgi:siroheme synthase